YAVLADFDHIDEFIPGMKSSEVLSAPDAPIRLRQVGDAGIGPFHTAIDVTLAVTTDAPTRIDFARVAGNLEQMNGSWIVAGDHARCGIAYRALIEPRFWVPPLIGPRLMRTQVEQQMQGLLQEIRRRAAGSQQPPAASPGSDDAGHARAVRQGG
ncbi:MAG: SRPBCC family protein, partial [Steroidobacteraceae bacterium]